MKIKPITGRDIERGTLGPLQLSLFKQPVTHNTINGYASTAVLPPNEFLKYQAAIPSVLRMLDFDPANRTNDTIKDIRYLELKMDDPVNQIHDGEAVISIYADNSVNSTLPIGTYIHLEFHINIYQMIMENLSKFKKDAFDAHQRGETSNLLDELEYYGVYFKVDLNIVTVQFTNKFKRELFKSPYFELIK